MHDSENPEDAAIGMTLIRAAQPYFACGIYSAADCIDMAVQKVSRPHSKLVCPSTDKPVNVSLDKQHGLFEVLSHFTMVEQDRFLDAYNLYHTANSKAGAKYNHTDPLFMFKGETHYILANNMDSPMLADFVVLMGRYRNYSDWRRTCLGAMHMSEEDFHAYVQSVIFTRWNKLEYDTPEYIMAVQPGTSIIGTEYEILRFPWHAFHYFDEETARRIAEDPDYINSDEFPGEYYWFCDGLIGATLTPYDIRNIAKCICPEINKRNPAAHAHVVYKPEDVYYAIKSIYTVKEEMTDDGLQLTIVGLRQRAIKLCAPKTEEINSTRNDMFRQMDEIIIDGRICLDDKRKRIGSLLHDGMANGCFTRRFVDRFMDELNKLPAFCGRAYQFNYEPGMTLAFYALMESQPQLPCTLQEIAETEFGTKDIIVNPVALDLKEKITTFLRPAAYEGKMFTFDELEALNALSVQLESLALVLNARNELMLTVKRATEQCLDSEKISFVWKGAVRQAVYDENHTDNAPALPENAAKTNVNLIFDDPRIVDSYRWYTMLYIISHDRSHSCKIVA